MVRLWPCDSLDVFACLLPEQYKTFKWKQAVSGPVFARERCRISPPRFLAECCKRQLNQGSFVLLYFRLFTLSDSYWVCLSVFSCTVLFVSISQVIDCEDRLRNDLYCVEWGVKLYSNSKVLSHETEARCWYASRLRCQGWGQYILIYEPFAKTSFSSETHTHTRV